MTFYAPTQQGFSSFFTLDRGLSQDAHDVRLFQSTRDYSSNSSFEFLKLQAVQQLSNALALASSDDWDGYQAFSADPSSLQYALSFISQLSSAFLPSDIAVDSDGEIAFDWDYEPRRIFSVRVGRDGSLNFAGLLGHTSLYGSEIMRDDIPPRVLSGIESVVKNRPW